MGPVGKVRSPWAVIGLSIITLGIYGLYWQYATFQEMKDHSNQGIGGVLGLVIGIFVGFVNLFLMPSEVGNLYAARGQEKRVSGATGCGIFLPIIGGFIWLFKVQGRLNDYWEATPPLTEGFAGATAPTA